MYENGLEDTKKHLNLGVNGAATLMKAGAVAVKSLPSCLYGDEPGSDLAELNAPEISLDLHNLIDESEGLFSEIGLLEGGQYSLLTIRILIFHKPCYHNYSTVDYYTYFKLPSPQTIDVKTEKLPS